MTEPAASELRTERLTLRRWRHGDEVALATVFCKPEVWWYPFRRGCSADETAAFVARKSAEWESRGWSQWAAIHRPNRRLIGFIGLAPPDFLPEIMPAVEIGWRIDPDYWGRGLATEGARAAMRFGFEVLGLEEIVSIYEPDNAASGRVMQRLGMTPERDTIHPELKVPLRVYRITRGAWQVDAHPSGTAER